MTQIKRIYADFDLKLDREDGRVILQDTRYKRQGDKRQGYNFLSFLSLLNFFSLSSV